MNRQIESNSLRAEIEAIFNKHGIAQQQVTLPTTLSGDDSQRVRNLAWRIVHGEIDPEEIAALSEVVSAQLNEMVQQIIALTNSETLKRLEEINPYYDAFPSKIIRDSALPEKEP